MYLIPYLRATERACYVSRTMPSNSPQKRLTKQDVLDLIQCAQMLEAAYRGIESTSIQGKPAILGLIDQVDTIVKRIATGGAAVWFPEAAAAAKA